MFLFCKTLRANIECPVVYVNFCLNYFNILKYVFMFFIISASILPLTSKRIQLCGLICYISNTFTFVARERWNQDTFFGG
jgi:hypothetical protein